MKRFLMASTLGCLLAVSALAGEISTSGSPAPVPVGNTTTNKTEPGDIPTAGAAERVSDAALSAVLTLFSLL